MALGFVVTLRNNMLDEITALIDAGTAGFLRIYSGTQPATCGTATTLLAQCTYSATSAPAASSGVLTHRTITDDSSADATGTASWYRAMDSAATCVYDGTVTITAGGGDLTLDSLSITAAQVVSVNSSVINANNA